MQKTTDFKEKNLNLSNPVTKLWWYFGLFWILCSSCTINIEDPEQELKDRIEAEEEISLSKVIGYWRADSGLQSGEKSIHPISSIRFEVLRNSTYYISDENGYLVDSADFGNFTFSGKEISLNSELGASSTLVGVTLTHLTNRWEWRPAQSGDILYFKKITPNEDPLFVALNADSSWWELGSWMRPSGNPEFLPMTNEFIYLTFYNDSLQITTNRGGLTQRETRTWSFFQDTLFTSAASSSFSHLFEFISTDSLRFWPIHNDTLLAPSGTGDLEYTQFKRVHGLRSSFRDLNPLMSYWRSDSLGNTPSHYGRYFDLEFRADGSVRSISNIDSLPDITTWNWDGSLSLSETGGNPVDYTFSFVGNRLFLNGPGVGGHYTKVNPQEFSIDPLKRFPNESFVHIAMNNDTLRFYFDQKYRKPSDLEQVQMTMMEHGRSGQISFTANPGSNSSQLLRSADPGFVFGFEMQVEGSPSQVFSIDTSLSTEGVMSIRSNYNSNDKTVTGTFTSGFVIENQTDTIAISGNFRYRRSSSGTFDDNFWNQIPKK